MLVDRRAYYLDHMRAIPDSEDWRALWTNLGENLSKGNGGSRSARPMRFKGIYRDRGK